MDHPTAFRALHRQALRLPFSLAPIETNSSGGVIILAPDASPFSDFIYGYGQLASMTEKRRPRSIHLGQTGALFS